MKTLFKVLVLMVAVGSAQQAACPRGRLYNCIEENVNKYADGVIRRALFPDAHFMWQQLAGGHNGADARIIHCETLNVLADIIRSTNQYWAIAMALPVGGGVECVDPYDDVTRTRMGRRAKAYALKLLADAERFENVVPGFDYNDRRDCLEFSLPFPVVSGDLDLPEGDEDYEAVGDDQSRGWWGGCSIS